jgi:hypothetical protein
MNRTHRHQARANGEWVNAAMFPSVMAGRRDARSPLMSAAGIAAPVHADQELMASLGIEFDTGAYRFAGVRFDSLADAVRHARLTMRLREDAGGR